MKILIGIRDAAKRVLVAARDAVVDLARTEPVRLASAVAAVVVIAVPGLISEEELTEILVQVLALLTGGEVVRRVVFSPATIDKLLGRFRG